MALRFRQSFSALREHAIGFMAREAFVLEHDRDRHNSAQPFDQRFDHRRLVSRLAIEPSRQPHHNGGQPVVIPHERSRLAGDCRGDLRWIAGARNRLPRTRKHPGGIRERKTDPALAVVDTHRSHH